MVKYKILTDFGAVDFCRADGENKVYIGGAIERDPDHKLKFERAKKYLEKRGYIVMTPTALPLGMTRADYMRIDFAMIDSADMVFFLRDTGKSPGASLELAYCNYIGKKHFVLIEEETRE